MFPEFLQRSVTSALRKQHSDVLDRRMSFMESYYAEPSKGYDVSGLEINLNDQNKGDGMLYALSKPHFDQKNHQLVLENIEYRPWRLTNIR